LTFQNIDVKLSQLFQNKHFRSITNFES